MAQVRVGRNTTGNAPSPLPPEEEWVQDVHGQWFQIRGPLPGKGTSFHQGGDGYAHQGDSHWEPINEVDVTLSNRYNLEAVNPGDNPAGTKMASGMTMEDIQWTQNRRGAAASAPVGRWWRNDYGDWEWWERPYTTSTTTATIGEEGEQDNLELMQRASSSSRPSYAHPSDVQALSEGAIEAPRRGIWKTALGNVLRNHRWKRGVPKRDLRVLLQYVEEDMGGEIAESTQEGEELACALVKEAVLRQILQHMLTLHAKDGDDQVLLLAEEQLETLEALLDEGELREDKPPLPRSQLPTASSQEEHPKMGEEAAGTGLGNSGTLAAHRPASQENPPGPLGEDDTRHVVHFIRRHGPENGLRIASSVLLASSRLKWGERRRLP